MATIRWSLILVDISVEVVASGLLKGTLLTLQGAHVFLHGIAATMIPAEQQVFVQQQCTAKSSGPWQNAKLMVIFTISKIIHPSRCGTFAGAQRSLQGVVCDDGLGVDGVDRTLIQLSSSPAVHDSQQHLCPRELPLIYDISARGQ